MRVYQLSDLVGNVDTISLIKRALVNNRLKNFIILAGTTGTGKSSSAEIIGLYLTCENPRNGEPCLECKHCTTNIRQLQSTGISTNLVKKDLSSLRDKKDVKDLIDDIFVLQGSVGNNVYILEEAHEFSHPNQTTLLERIDRLGENTYVIICTTRPHRLLVELRDRAISYDFKRLNNGEAKLLFNKTIQKFGLKSTPSVESMILRYSRGIPRNIVNLVEFVKENYPTEKELRSFLGFIPNEMFIELFNSTKDQFSIMVDTINTMLLEYSLETVVYQLKEFIVNCIYTIETGTSEEFSRSQLKDIKNLFTEDVCYKVANVLEKFDTYNCTEPDFRLLLIKLRQIVLGKNASSFKDNNKIASKQKMDAQNAFTEEQESIMEDQGVINKPLSMEFLNKFGKG